MMEIFINEYDWKSPDRSLRISQIIEKLNNCGWKRFGRSGAVVMFKDTNEESAMNEMKELGINEIKPETWEENNIELPYSDI